MDDTHEFQHLQVAVPGRVKVCKICGVEKPLDAANFHQQMRTNKNGERKSHGWQTVCKPCDLAKFKLWAATRKAADAQAKAEGRPPTPPVVRALNRAAPTPLQAPKRPNLRAILEAEAEQNYERLAKKLVKTAVGDGKDAAGALKLVFSYILGTPREASDDQGPTEFWHTLLASARAQHAGQSADLAPPDDDLGDAAGPD